MHTSNLIKKLSMATAGAAFVALGATLVNASVANAAIFALDNSHSWATGSDTLESVLGFDMVEVPNDPLQAEFSFISTLSSPLGSLTFNPVVEKRDIGSSWQTWSHGYDEEVYFTGNSTNFMNISLPSNIAAFDLYVEPNNFFTFQIEVIASNGSATTLTQNVQGFRGAKYFGFYTTDGDIISHIKITAPQAALGLAAGEFRMASSQPVPEPASALGLLLVITLGAGSALKIGRGKRERE
ncbi:MAG TPA: PEP-CTERM sorting domain-containing protein [Cyanobacteria bacterium UBA8803]|nr:PEP-CTERM sorting domain-containing protein [Cyanobacteria bacterium UBA9273]HBL62374.1 PEP-CTERM sorting domain-containing protein [Cyanobacteria bacterium UBA8803]